MRKQTRQECLLRDGFCCVKCHKEHRKGLQIHHVMPRRLFGPDELWNLACLCQKCHSNWHKYEDKHGICWDPRGILQLYFSWLENDDFLDDEINMLLDLYQENLKFQLEILLEDDKGSRKSKKQAYFNKPR